MSTAPLSLLRVIEHFITERLPSVLPISLPHFLLNRLAQIPKIPIMIAKDIVRQFMTERIPNDLVFPISVIRVRPQPQLYDLASIPIQTQRARFVRRVVGRVHLRQHADAKLVFAHAGFDTGVVAQALEELLRARGAREVAKWQDGLEGVGCLVLGLLPITVAIWGRCFGGGGGLGSGGSRAGRLERAELGVRGRKKDYCL